MVRGKRKRSMRRKREKVEHIEIIEVDGNKRLGTQILMLCEDETWIASILSDDSFLIIPEKEIYSITIKLKSTIKPPSEELERKLRKFVEV